MATSPGQCEALSTSNGDRAFAMAMFPDHSGSTLSTVAKRIGKGTNHASAYKKRLFKQGVIAEHPGNIFEFDIPLLREYLLKQSGEAGDF